eukprot:5957034-Pyramimonas_sp.AAC.1
MQSRLRPTLKRQRVSDEVGGRNPSVQCSRRCHKHGVWDNHSSCELLAVTLARKSASDRNNREAIFSPTQHQGQAS